MAIPTPRPNPPVPTVVPTVTPAPRVTGPAVPWIVPLPPCVNRPGSVTLRLKPYVTKRGAKRLRVEIRVRRGVVGYVRFSSGKHRATVRRYRGGGFSWRAPAKTGKVKAVVVFNCGQRITLTRTRS
jgi:hypothetical protein